MVCQYRSTSRGALQRCTSQLATMGARIFGAVLNRVETRAGGYFRKTYREFYEYHETDDLEEGAIARPRLDAAAIQSAAGAGEDAAAGTAVAEALDTELPSLLGDDLERDATDDLTAQAAEDDIDREINKINADDALGDSEDFKIADDLDLGEDFDKPKA
jgi:hypothetical protein